MIRPTSLASFVTARAHSPATRYGEPPRPLLPHPAPEAAITGYDGALVAVRAQSVPTMPDDPPLSLVAFRAAVGGTVGFLPAPDSRNAGQICRTPPPPRRRAP